MPLTAPFQTTNTHSDVKLSRKTLSRRTTKPIISFFFLSPCIIHPSLYLQHSKNEPVTHPGECCWHISLCHVLHLIRSIQPPHVQTRHGYYASSADRKHGAGKLKSQETKEVAGEWKNKWWLPSLLQSGDMLRVILVSWYAVVRWWCAGQGQFRTESRAQGWQEAKRSNCSLSPNKYMDEWAHPPFKREGYRDQRGAVAVSGLTSELLG